MINKRIPVLVTIWLCLFSLMAAGCGTDNKNTQAKPPMAPSLILKLAETHPPDYPTTLGDKKFAELVAERSSGRIRVDVYPSSQLGEEKSAIEQVQLGNLAFTRISSAPLAEFHKPLGVFSLPYIFDSPDHMWKFLESPDAAKLIDGLQASKFVGLCYYDAGARSFYTTKPIKDLPDLKGLKIRVQQSTINMEMISALGATADPMPYGQVFSALQIGVIDGAENNFPSYLTASHFQVAKYYLRDGHQMLPEVLIMSKTVWDKIAPDDQKLIKQAAHDSVKTQRELWKNFEKASEEKVKASGTIVTEIRDIKAWQAAVKPVIDKYAPTYRETLDVIAKFR